MAVGIKTDDTAVAWGYNICGSLGDGSTTDRCQPVAVCCNYCYSNFIGVCNGTSNMTIIGTLTNGCAVSWGSGTCNYLGDGTTVAKCQPVAVCCNYTYTKIINGGMYLCSPIIGIKTDGCAVAWGFNNAGQLGDNSTTNRCQPVAVCCNYTYKDVVVGQCHVYGLKCDGNLVSWGNNNAGQLADNSTTNRCQPVATCSPF
jgi:alpha-tubulin suppressor-like RCC1 family protein